MKEKILKEKNINIDTVFTMLGVKKDKDSSPLRGFVFLVVLVLLLLVAGSVISYIIDEPAYVIGFCFCIPLVIFFMIGVAIRIKILGNHVKKGDFYIKEDICEKKKHKIWTGTRPSQTTHYYYLYFKENGKLSLTLTYANFLPTQSELFEAANEGDKFYILFVGKNKIIYTFNSNEWTLDTRSFIKDGDVYRPRILLD